MTENRGVGDGARGLALSCTRDGTVTRVLLDDFGWMGSGTVGQRFTELVDESSRAKAERFVAETVVRGGAFDWELGVQHEGTIQLLRFAAAAESESSMLVVGATTTSDALRYYDALMRINNEQANALRAAFKVGRDGDAAVRVDRDANAYEMMMSLNNQLATLQRDLTKKNIELERVNALKNQFVGMAAHDLRNPIAAISSYSDLLLYPDFEMSREQQQHFLRRIRESSRFMLALINDLLDIATIESGQLRIEFATLDLGVLVHENVEFHRLLARDKHIALHDTIEPGIPMMLGESAKLEQIVNNLVGNAIKFSQADTRIDVRVAAVNAGVAVSVQDEGPGIPADELDGIFTPFQRASTRATAQEHSTGLGLAIVKRLVDAHAGTLTCESEVGRGTTFTAWFPAASAA
ncbi:MAG: HAMP domain-containing sensor histidine kinase [Gemmatimonas sp.]